MGGGEGAVKPKGNFWQILPVTVFVGRVKGIEGTKKVKGRVKESAWFGLTNQKTRDHPIKIKGDRTVKGKLRTARVKVSGPKVRHGVVREAVLKATRRKK